MQRWIIAAGVLFVLLVLGGGIGYHTHQMNRQIHPVLLQFPLPAEVSPATRDATVQTLREKLGETALLTQVSKDVGLAKKLRLATNEAAVSDLAKRLFVEPGVADLPQGRVPVISIGLNCKVKEYNLMVEVGNHLNKAIKAP